MSLFWKIFLTVFLAEMGDKTQIATLTAAAAAPDAKKWIFLGAAGALVAPSVIAVLCGDAISRIPFLTPRNIKISAGVVFIVFGALYLVEAFRMK